MKRSDAFELYTDYLIANNGQATATELSALTDNQLKHDYISDWLSQTDLDQKEFWKQIKKFVRQIETDESWISIDDTICAKPHSTRNEVINYHFDHSVGKSVKGINILNFLLSSNMKNDIVNCPVAYHVIKKTKAFVDSKGKTKFKSVQTKNDIFRQVLENLQFKCVLKFKYILFDLWFSSSDNMDFIHKKLKKIFVCPIKKNRLVALSYEDKLAGNFVAVNKLDLSTDDTLTVYIKGNDFPTLLVKEVYTNIDLSTAEIFLVTNDVTMNYRQITTIYEKRWKVEEFHKSIKQNILLGKSPTKTEITQCNHIFACNIAFIRLEKLKIKERLNHFALKAKLHLKMVKAAMDELYTMKKAIC